MMLFKKSMLFVLFLCSIVGGWIHSSLAASPTYKLGTRDIISVSIFAGGEEQVKVDLTVADQGTVNFPFIGTTKVKGLTTSELENSVRTPLQADYFVDPQVHIQVKDYQSLQFSISGAVKNPGNYPMSSDTTVMDLIAKAGGVLPERGNIAYVMRNAANGQSKGKNDPEQKENEKVNLQKLLDEGDMSNNLKLETGDSVYVPLAKGLHTSESKIYVSGEVKKPSPYEYQPGLTALGVCIEAGGFTQYAAPNRATIVRNEDGEQKIIKIDLEKVTKGDLQDIPLKPGDRLNIPESWL